MIKQLINDNNSSLVYCCNIGQFENLLIDEKLTLNDLNRLKYIFEEHNRKSNAFIFSVQKSINKLIKTKNCGKKK